jgi:DHA2 family multidrug resistance protein-like MFS transporter
MNAPDQTDGLHGSRRWWAILSITMGTILTTISGSMINIALPTLSRDLHVTDSAAVLVVTVYQLILMMTLLPFAALGDRIGHRAVYQCGQVIFVVATMLSFFAASLPFLLLVRAFQALGAAGALSVSSALIRQVYPAARLGRGLSLNTVMAAGFASLAPTVGGMILSVANWPWLFAALVPFGIVSVLAGRKSLPDPVIHDSPYDIAGAVLCAATFGFAVIGLESGLHGDSPVISAAVVLLGLGIGVIFVRRELVQERPMLPVDLMRRADIALPSIGLMAGYLSSMIVMLALPFMLQQRFHFTPTAAGAVLAPWVAPAAGLLSDRYPAGLLGGMGMMVAVIGLLGLAFLPDAPTHLNVIWPIVVCGTGFGMFYSPVTRQIIASAPATRTAAAGGLTTTIRGSGQTLGATAVATLLASGLGTGPTTALTAAGLAIVAGICCFLALRPPARSLGVEEMPEV